MICVFINMTGTPEGSTESGFMEKPGIEPATPGLQGIALIHYTTGGLLKLYGSKTFCGFPGYKPVPPGWFKIVCLFYVGNTQRLTESGFMETPGIEPATPGLQGIALIHYTTGGGGGGGALNQNHLIFQHFNIFHYILFFHLR